MSDHDLKTTHFLQSLSVLTGVLTTAGSTPLGPVFVCAMLHNRAEMRAFFNDEDTAADLAATLHLTHYVSSDPEHVVRWSGTHAGHDLKIGAFRGHTRYTCSRTKDPLETAGVLRDILTQVLTLSDAGEQILGAELDWDGRIALQFRDEVTATRTAHTLGLTLQPTDPEYPQQVTWSGTHTGRQVEVTGFRDTPAGTDQDEPETASDAVAAPAEASTPDTSPSSARIGRVIPEPLADQLAAAIQHALTQTRQAQAVFDQLGQPDGSTLEENRAARQADNEAAAAVWALLHAHTDTTTTTVPARMPATDPTQH